MENSHQYTSEELLKCPYHSQQDYLYVSQEDNKETGKPDQAGTDPNRYGPNKFEKGTDENSGGDGSTESAAEHLENL